MPLKKHKKRRLGTTEAGSQRQRATQINEVWCYDFLYHPGGQLKWLPICDEFTRESIALAGKRRMEAPDKKLRAEIRERWVIAESTISQ